jgi:hypothetical protein
VTGSSPPDPAATARLTHLDRVFINLDNATYRWVDIKRFALPAPAPDDASILAALIDHEVYGDNYAGGDPGSDPERHGPYWRDRITPACYDPVDADSVERQVRFWAEQYAPLPEQVRPELQREVYGPLHAVDRVYRLRDLGRDAFHDWGWVLGEFHECALIDDARGTLALVVAADD